MDGFYEPDRAVAALESNDPKQVAELLETPPWNPTMQEMCLGGFLTGDWDGDIWGEFGEQHCRIELDIAFYVIIMWYYV